MAVIALLVCTFDTQLDQTGSPEKAAFRSSTFGRSCKSIGDICVRFWSRKLSDPRSRLLSIVTRHSAKRIVVRGQ